MKFSRSGLLVALSLAGAAYGELSSWVRHTEAASSLEQAFFRLMPMPGGQVLHRRPPQESRAELGRLIEASPTRSDLYALRALEAERAGDFAAAEPDWRKQTDPLALADFYHRRLNTPEELKALEAAADTAPVFERMVALADAQLLPASQVEGIYQRWRDKLPQTEEPWKRGIAFLIRVKRFETAAEWVTGYARAFPAETSTALSLRADLEKARGNARAGLDVYDRAFDPLWPAPLMESYFKLLREARATRAFLAAARAQAQADPAALGPAARIYHYYTQEGNAAAGVRALMEYQRRKSSWNAAELAAMAELWLRAGNATEAARSFFALYHTGEPERALAGLIDLLLTGPHGLAIGAGDLGFYKDIATADSGPGMLNGIASLLLNSSRPADRFVTFERSATVYLERARAAELLASFEQRFPSSARRAGLRAQLIQAYGAHGQSQAVIRAGRDFLAAFPEAGQRGQVTLAMADAYAAEGQIAQEFAAYDGLLGELASKAGGTPLAKSPEYARVLDRYVSRLVVLKRPKDALVLLRREIDRNPNDAGLYERLAAFLDQNKMAAEIEQVYRKAAEQFPDRSWYHKLARYYLRGKRVAQFQQLTGDVTKIFSGTDLERYFAEVVAPGAIDAAMYRQVNLYANQRFPHNLTFVRNLLVAYQTRGTADPVAYENLLRRHWFYDAGLRARFFEHLSRTGRLAGELRALGTEAHPAALRMRAEGEAWRSHFEQAAEPMRRVFEQAPGDGETGPRTVSLHRSLVLPAAEALAAKVTEMHPRDGEAWTTLGEIAADKAPRFRRLAEIDPGVAEGYLNSATLFWDYFDYDDALAMIERGRKTLGDAALNAYEAGAIYENKRDYGRAIAEYTQGAIAQPGGSAAQERLLALARRPALRQAIDQATASLGNPGLALRIALLEQQQRKADLEALLDGVARSATNFEMLARVEDESRRLGLPAVEERALRREIDLTADPVDKLRLRLNLARVFENRKDLAQASSAIDALYRENPVLTGIVRAAVDYHWRNRNHARALEILTAAESGAHASLKPEYAFEFARKATEAGQYAAGRQSLDRLLAADPYNTSYLGAYADSYAREGNDDALKAFYTDKIKVLAGAPDRVARIAAMRRALAGVLVRTKDVGGALDQYIEVLNRYPEDAVLAEEVAGFARRNQVAQRLTAFYQKTTAESPKDFRYHLLLARIQTALEDYAAAVEAYTKAAAVRPDRADFLEARGGLEVRLMRFAAAAATYEKLYELSYRNSVWMDRVAEMQARQGRVDDTVAALRKAYPETPLGQFEIARRLESWDLLEQARTFADRGVALAGGALLTDNFSGAELYARILTRQRQYQALTGVDAEGKLLGAVADAAARYYSSEEKRQLGAYFDQRNADSDLGRRAGMAEWEARKLHQQMMAAPGPPTQFQMNKLVELQRRRMALRELGGQLEAFWKVYPPAEESRQAVLEESAKAYAGLGDDAAELRVRALMRSRTQRYLDLLAKRNPKALIAEGSDDAVNAAIASGDANLALAAVAGRKQAQPVWTRSYTALVGVYFGLKTPPIEAAFQAALDSMRIGDRLGHATNRDERLVTGDWFYYAARYGEYLDLLGKPGAEDYLPAGLESSPADEDEYFALGEYDRGKGRPAEAMAEYELALQLEPKHAGALNRSAQLLLAGGKRDLAVARWKVALDSIVTELDARRPRYTLSGDLEDVVEQLAGNRLLLPLRDDVERAMVAMSKRHLPLSENLIRRYAQAIENPLGAVLGLSGQVREPEQLLEQATGFDWLDAGQREMVYQRLLEVARSKATAAVGDQKQEALGQYHRWQYQWLDSLLRSGQTERMKAAMASLAPEDRERLAPWLSTVQILLAPAAYVAKWRANAGDVPDSFTIRDAASRLRQNGDLANAKMLLRFAYERDIDSGMRDAGTLAGYAELLLEENDTAGAVRVLRRMALLAEPAFSAHVTAGRLLERAGRTEEALQFYAEAVKATPWDRDAKAALAPATTAAAGPPALAAAEARVRELPDDAQAKVTLFRAARAAGRHTFAITTLETMHPEWVAGRLFGTHSPEAADPGIVEQFLNRLQMTAAQRAAVAREAGDSLARLGRTANAITLVSIAQQLAGVARDKQQVEGWKAELNRLRENERRMPVATANLRPDRIVRPMVAAGGAR